MKIEVGTTAQRPYIFENGTRVWPYYWLECVDGQWFLCKKSHPELPDDENMDRIDCEAAFGIDVWGE